VRTSNLSARETLEIAAIETQTAVDVARVALKAALGVG
jgi:hypothetical protein